MNKMQVDKDEASCDTSPALDVSQHLSTHDIEVVGSLTLACYVVIHRAIPQGEYLSILESGLHTLAIPSSYHIYSDSPTSALRRRAGNSQSIAQRGRN